MPQNPEVLAESANNSQFERRAIMDFKRSAFGAFAAIAWSLLLVVLAIVLPIYTVSSNHPGLQPRHSLIRVYGYDVLLMAAAPLFASLAVLGLLYLAHRYALRSARILAWAISLVVEIAAFVGFITFLIGVFVLPVGAGLIAACATIKVGTKSCSRSSPEE